ncbi:MAG: sugar ABC transporter ATP-binding protein [Verrucomicrobia bacterium]|nr:sugar ABC transporter ATP-binding protein [Verrucomicrobiota bacterium]
MNDRAAGQSPPRLVASGICKSFPGVRALHDVHLRVHPGEVLALLGENGAGKSTLMKILAGVQKPDAGTLEADGVPIPPGSVQEALRQGIALIHQELNLATNLTVGANIFLGREPNRHGWIDEKAIAAEARRVLDLVGLDLDPSREVGDLTLGQMQLVEIAKALSVNARVLILDEPTSSLSARETERLFAVMNELRDRGVSLIYISHRLAEIHRMADRVTVLRDGVNAGELARAEISHDAMVRLMVGRDVSRVYQRTSGTPGAVVLEVNEVRTAANPGHGVSLQVRAGEIVGLAGLIGAGRTELLEALFGVNPPLSGEIRVEGRILRAQHPRDAVLGGLALVPEDRKKQGVVLAESVRRNLSLASLERDRVRGFLLNEAAESGITERMIRELRIKTPGEEQPVRFLSGGNQQKVVIGKWLAMSPRVFLLDEPTRGIDVGAKQEIYQLMEKLAASGAGILFVSSELEEILGLADRVLVMHEGKLAGDLRRDELTEERIMTLATGGQARDRSTH